MVKAVKLTDAADRFVSIEHLFKQRRARSRHRHDEREIRRMLCTRHKWHRLLREKPQLLIRQSKPRREIDRARRCAMDFCRQIKRLAIALHPIKMPHRFKACVTTHDEVRTRTKDALQRLDARFSIFAKARARDVQLCALVLRPRTALSHELRVFIVTSCAMQRLKQVDRGFVRMRASTRRNFPQRGKRWLRAAEMEIHIGAHEQRELIIRRNRKRCVEVVFGGNVVAHAKMRSRAAEEPDETPRRLGEELIRRADRAYGIAGHEQAFDAGGGCLASGHAASVSAAVRRFGASGEGERPASTNPKFTPQPPRETRALKTVLFLIFFPPLWPPRSFRSSSLSPATTRTSTRARRVMRCSRIGITSNRADACTGPSRVP